MANAANLDSGHFEPLDLDNLTPPQAAPEEAEVEVTPTAAPEQSSGLDVEIIDDTPEEDRGKPRRDAAVAPDIPTDEDLASHSEGVQKRIKKLRYEYHEERRQKEEAARLRDEAVAHTRRIMAENDQLRQGMVAGQENVLSQAKARATAELETAQAKFKDAYEAGDPELLLEAQQKLNRVQNDLFRIDAQAARPKPPTAQQQQAQQEYENARQQAAATPQPPQVPVLDDQQKAWAAANEDWFGKDEAMTGFAFGVHERLVKSGVDPHSEKYYSEIDKEMLRVFPDEFSDATEAETESVKKPATVVAPAKRTAKTSRKVKITASQARLAKRLGITIEQYAAQLMKETQNG